jgi:glutamate-1-semialdehyde aminotransferase
VRLARWVLIFDEVVTGLLATRGAQARLGVTPDRTLGAEFSVPRPGRHAPGMELVGNDSMLHGGTFNSNLVSTSAAIAALDELS